MSGRYFDKGNDNRGPTRDRDRLRATLKDYRTGFSSRSAADRHFQPRAPAKNPPLGGAKSAPESRFFELPESAFGDLEKG